MACDCATAGLDEVFDERLARRDARRFVRRGLPLRARRLVAAIERALPLKGVESLEIGAGAGGFSITLLERGAARATTIDASPAFVAAARALARERDVAERMDVIAGDFAAQPDVAAAADVVVLDRVICCYPDLPGLLGPAVARARRVVALSYPRDSWWSRLAVRTVNACLALLRRRFRMRFHSPQRVRSILSESGLGIVSTGHVAIWELVVAARI